MAFIVELTYEAENDLDSIRAFYQNQILNALDDFLQHTPTIISTAHTYDNQSIPH